MGYFNERQEDTAYEQLQRGEIFQREEVITDLRSQLQEALDRIEELEQSRRKSKRKRCY